jgi:hypothetical protein
MQCVEFEDRLNRLLDHRLSPDDDGPLSDHARDCECCAGVLRAQRSLFAGLKRGRPQAAADFAERVVAQFPKQARRRNAFWKNASWGLLLASAASLAGFALISLATQSKDRGNMAHPPARPAGPGVSNSAIAKAGPQKAGQHGQENLGVYFVALENLATQFSDSKEFDEVSESLEPSIKPIRSSFGLALDALRRTLPRGKEPRSSRPDAGAHWLPESLILS